ncbi:MAG: hypothetical protein IKY91_08310 [Akkermansia sp.]|nr:hypothetical protein [Akkermansia sp.]
MNLLVIFLCLVVLFLSVVCGVSSRCIKEQGDLLGSLRELIETQDKLIEAYRRNCAAKDRIISSFKMELALREEDE